ncbi:Semaphorin-5B [Nymphon striatum]|nr:Semaphorin-5B [Nymphon striatum]
MSILVLKSPRKGYPNLQSEMKVFTYPGIYFYSQILFDVSRNQLLVGARDHLFRLDMDGLGKLEDVQWKARRNAVKMCKQKGQSSEDCHNYIRVLQSNKSQVLACGTNAFNPKCSWRPIDDLKTVTKRINGVAKVPYSPHHNITTLMTKNGDYYFASVLDFSARDAAIFRIMGKSPIIRTVQYDSKWLNEPNFVGSFEIGDFTYFFFRETAIEYQNCGKVIYSRVARMCKNDVGGRLVLKENWTTFLKARLNCSIGGEYPFYFNEIQKVFYIEGSETFYATFTTPDNSIYGTAVCAFNLSSVNEAFNGPFKYQDSPTGSWQRRSSPHNHFQCNTPGNSKQLLDSNRYQLMDEAVQPIGNRPIHFEELSRFSHIVADVVPTKNDYTGVHVIFVATFEGVIRKFSINQKSQKACLLEEIEPFDEFSGEKILTMKILRDTNSLYIGTNKSVKKISIHRCHRFKSRRSCMSSRDPYCGWNSHQLACTTAPHRNPLSSFWHQDVSSCPILSDPVNGDWSDWGEWNDCTQTGSNTLGDRCKCRQRTCSSPPPMNGGRNCAGHSQEEMEAGLNGQLGQHALKPVAQQGKFRRRTCGNPKPSFGGRICVGPEREEIFCSINPPCPIPTPPKVNGQWSAFGPWQECSAKCGGGIQVRRRKCDSPFPKNGGAPCSGCNLEYRPCNSHSCPEVRQPTAWTPWMQYSNSSLTRGFYEIRHRFVLLTMMDEGCTDASSDVDGGLDQMVKLDRPAPACVDEGCREGYENAQTQFQWVTGDECEGADIEERPCNAHRCPGTWSCWSEYGNCSVTCGGGTKLRTRKCVNPSNVDEEGIGCKGLSTEVVACDRGPCFSLRGWGEWSVWSECSGQRLQVRQRLCNSNRLGLCRGPDVQERLCVTVALAGNAISEASQQISISNGVKSMYVVPACIACFLVGTFIGCLIMYYYFKRNGLRHFPKLENHFISAKDNHYVTSFELDSKSAFSTMNGTLRKALPISAQSTLKKNSVYNANIRGTYLDEAKNFEL